VFVGDDVKATIDGESVNTISQHIYVADKTKKRAFVYSESGQYNESLSFSLHTTHSDIEGIAEANGIFYLLNRPSGSTHRLTTYSINGEYFADLQIDLHADNSSGADVSIVDNVAYILNNVSGTKHVYAYNITSKQRVTSEESTLPNTLENCSGFSLYNGNYYCADARNSPSSTQKMRVFRKSDSAALANLGFDLHSDNGRPTGVYVDASAIRVCDRTAQKIFFYDHSGTHQKTIDLDSANTDAQGLTIIKSSSHMLRKIESQIELTRKMLTNRRKVDSSANTITTYDDDASTTLVVKNLKDASGNASSDEVYEEDPA